MCLPIHFKIRCQFFVYVHTVHLSRVWLTWQTLSKRISLEQLFTNPIVTSPRLRLFFDAVQHDAASGESLPSLGSMVKSIRIRLPQPPSEAEESSDMAAWRELRTLMAEDAINATSVLENAERDIFANLLRTQLFPNLKLVAVSSQHAQWWEEQEWNVGSERNVGVLRKTHRLTQQLVSSMGSDVEFRQHGLVGPLSLNDPLESKESPYRFDGTFSVHIDDLVPYALNSRWGTLPGLTNNLVIDNTQSGVRTTKGQFEEFLLGLRTNHAVSRGTPRTINIWGPLRSAQSIDELGDPTSDPARQMTLETLQGVLDPILRSGWWSDNVSVHYLEDAPQINDHASALEQQR